MIKKINYYQPLKILYNQAISDKRYGNTLFGLLNFHRCDIY